MQSTNTPAKVLTALADQDSSRAELPNTTSDPTRASQTQGFPPLTGQPPEAGGVPPQLPDMNGALNMASRLGWWGQLGGRWAFDGSFANNSAINGYPRGALLMSADFTGEWLSNAEANTANPDTVGTGWVPGYHYGATTLANQAGGTVVLTPAQAAKTTLFVNGTLTSNLIIEVPAWIREWTVYNGTSGAFTVSVRTPGRPAVVVPQASIPSVVRGNGTDVAVATLDVPLASTTVAGRTRYATAAEAINGSIQDAAVTPFALQQANPLASETVIGRVRYANAGEYAAGTPGLAVQPSQLSNKATLGQAATFAALNPSGGVSQQGFQVTWNSINVGGGRTENINNRGTGDGGHYFYRRVDGNQTPVLQFFVNAQNELTSVGAVASQSGRFIGSNAAAVVAAAAGAGVVALRPNGPEVATGEVRVESSGNMTVNGSVSASGGFDTPSSREIKNDLGPFPYGLGDVLALQSIRYAYKDDPDQRARLGFYLEDVREVAPEVAGAAAIQEHQVIPMLVAAIQELTAEVRELRALSGL